MPIPIPDANHPPRPVAGRRKSAPIIPARAIIKNPHVRSSRFSVPRGGAAWHRHPADDEMGAARGIGILPMMKWGAACHHRPADIRRRLVFVVHASACGEGGAAWHRHPADIRRRLVFVVHASACLEDRPVRSSRFSVRGGGWPRSHRHPADPPNRPRRPRRQISLPPPSQRPPSHNQRPTNRHPPPQLHLPRIADGRSGDRRLSCSPPDLTWQAMP